MSDTNNRVSTSFLLERDLVLLLTRYSLLIYNLKFINYKYIKPDRSDERIAEANERLILPRVFSNKKERKKEKKEKKEKKKKKKRRIGDASKCLDHQL